MFLDENGVILFQKSPWNAVCKNGILLKIPLFSKNTLRRFLFNQTAQHHRFCTFNSTLMLQKSLGALLKSSGKNRVFLRKLKMIKFEP